MTLIADEARRTLDEEARLQSLRSYNVLDTPAQNIFDEFARLAASIGETPTALISLVDGTRQWFKARVGLSAEETPRNVAFCAHAIESDDVFVVPDATRDARFAQNPLVTGSPGIRFYAGAPLITLDGHALGTVCVIDYVAREFSMEQQDALQALSRQVMAQLELRRRLANFSHNAVAGRQTADAIRRALMSEEFLLHYQPVVDAPSGRIIALEALLRWSDPVRGPLPPAEFLGAMEESGLIVQVGEWVLRRASDDCQEWAARGTSPPPVSVNISRLHLSHPSFLAHLAHLTQALKTAGAHEPCLEIEVSEAILAHNPAASIRRLHEIQQLGVHICIDDFGAGESLFRHLGRMPVDSLKIDRALIARMAANREDQSLVAAIISLANSLNLEVVAKGVETDEQRTLLQSLGCNCMQGFLFSAPASMQATEHALRRAQAEVSLDWKSSRLQVERTPF